MSAHPAAHRDGTDEIAQLTFVRAPESEKEPNSHGGLASLECPEFLQEWRSFRCIAERAAVLLAQLGHGGADSLEYLMGSCIDAKRPLALPFGVGRAGIVHDHLTISAR